MPDESSQQITAYIRDLFLPHDEVLEGALRRAQEAGLRSIQVPAEVGRLLGILARAIGARRILEIGTLGGYSAIHLARALPEDGRLITLELDPHHAEVARENLEAAGLSSRVEVRLGRALDVLPSLTAEAPFDLAFIDADKESYPAYLDWCLRLVRPGGLIVADNVLGRGRGGGAGQPGSRGGGSIDAMNRAAASDPRFEAIILPVRDGSDGILVGVVREQHQA
jgi:predicted O-methyltransferase YrrM